jgi:putative resolvase
VLPVPQYALEHGIKYRAAWNRYKAGKIPGAFQDEFGKILIRVEVSQSQRVAIYARVSSAENKTNLDAQAERLVQYCMARGYQVVQVVKEIGSGVNDTRKKLLKLLADTSITLIVVEHKDRLTRFGSHYIETLLETQERRLEIVNQADNGKEDLVQDLVSIIYSFSARMYGQRRAKRKTEQIMKTLQDTHAQEA